MLSLPKLLILGVSCFYEQSAVIFRCWPLTDKCGKGACGSPHQSSSPIHNGLLCPPYFPPALSRAQHRVCIVLNKVTVSLGRLTSLGSKKTVHWWLNKLGQKASTATSPQPGLWPKLPSEIIASHEIQLSFENLTALWMSDVLKLKEILSGGPITAQLMS